MCIVQRSVSCREQSEIREEWTFPAKAFSPTDLPRSLFWQSQSARAIQLHGLAFAKPVKTDLPQTRLKHNHYQLSSSNAVAPVAVYFSFSQTSVDTKLKI